MAVKDDGIELRRSLTMADYLKSEERGVDSVVGLRMDEEVENGGGGPGGVGGEDFATFQCLTPREIVAKWIRKLRRKSRKVETGLKGGQSCRLKEVSEVGNGELMMQGSCSTKFSTEEKLLQESVSRVDHGNREPIASFKIGAGIGLALVVAASKRELDKMVELRAQMEKIVEDAKEELEKKGAVPVFESSHSCENRTYSTTNIEEGMMNSSGEASVFPSFQGSNDSPYIEIDDKDWCRGRCDGEAGCVLEGMSELEAELETELQLLELQLESEDTSSPCRTKSAEEPVSESSDSFCEAPCIDEEVSYTNDPLEAFTEVHYDGVPPHELERRLHELLEAQQQERIEELEAALRRTKHKLRKKELEVCWWRDTAHPISHHASRTTTPILPTLKDQTQQS